LGVHVDLAGWADRLNHFDLPVTCIGLGAQSEVVGKIPVLPEGTQTFLEVVNKFRRDTNQPNILTRGEFSSEVIKHYGYDSAPHGCPSQFISPEVGLGQKCLAHQSKNKYQRIMTAAGNPWHASASLERVLVELVNNYQGDYVLQHPECLFHLSTGKLDKISLDQRHRLEKVYGFLGDLNDISEWFQAYGVYFADAQNWMHYSKHFSMVIGPRYHGVALPVQTGVPGKVIAIDSRTEELSSTTGIPFVRYKDVESHTAEELIQICRWEQQDADFYDEQRSKNAQGYMPFLEANGLAFNDYLNQLV
jgi:hypothetical protein